MKSIQDEIIEIGQGFSDISDFSDLLQRIKDKKIVMLGESSHGTQEFYEWRRRLSKTLITDFGFSFIAVEGDWPPCEKLNRYIQDEISNPDYVMTGFSRWPTWMWGNTEVMRLMDDLKEINQELSKQIGFHGLDVYSLFESMDEAVKKLKDIDPSLAQNALRLYSCFDPFKQDERAYAHSLYQMPEGCEEEVVKVLKQILQKNLLKDQRSFDVIQNARIIKNAERYYRAMISFDEDSWNVRDQHMMETLDNLLEYYGSDSKAIIWAHNTHIGDYRATSMASHGQVNLGGLAREKYGASQVALIGLTTFSGEVIASKQWDGAIQVMSVPNAVEGSLEFALHEAVPRLGVEKFYLDFTLIQQDSQFLDVMGNRAIGVVYHPMHEHRGNYVPTIPAKRYDALLFFDKTNALTPINERFRKERYPDTFPYGDQI